MRDRKFFIAVSSFFLIFVILMVIATAFDYKISEKFADLSGGEYYSENFFGRFFEIFGEMPLYIFFGFGFSIIYLNGERLKNKFFTILIKSVCFVCLTGSFAYGLYKLESYLNNFFGFLNAINTKFVLILFCNLIAGILLAVLSVYCISRTDRAFINGLLIWALIVVITGVLSTAVIQILKSASGRIRYRTIYVLNYNGVSGYGFKKWYVFGGVPKITSVLSALGIGKDGFKSFPSGHAGCAAIWFTIVMLPLSVKKLNNFKSKALLFFLAFVFTGLVAISRIIMGAHYLSDVVIGWAVTVICLFISEILSKTLVKRFGNDVK